MATIEMVADQNCVEGSEELQLVALPERGVGPYTYAWTGPNNFSSSDSIAVLVNINETMSGTYQLEVTDASGCLATVVSQTVDITNGIVEPTIGISALSCEGGCLLYTSPSPRDATLSRMPSSA